MPHVISVEPAASGWMVTSSASLGPLIFERGGEAEAAARRLGEELSARGQAAQINVHLRDGQLAASLVCAPWPEGEPKDPEVIWPAQTESN
jgi:hypothetical protein